MRPPIAETFVHGIEVGEPVVLPFLGGLFALGVGTWVLAKWDERRR